MSQVSVAVLPSSKQNWMHMCCSLRLAIKRKQKTQVEQHMTLFHNVSLLKKHLHHYS